jgi:hypothetical protein
MVVRIRVQVGMVRTRREPEFLAAVARFRRWLGLASGVALLLALWRLAFDLNLAGRFADFDGLFSHWQFWMAVALLFQIVDAMLARFGAGGAATP